MDRATVDVYDRRGEQWARRRRPVRAEDAVGFGRSLPTGTRRVDLGCGAGRYLKEIGSPAVGVDASAGMLRLCRVAVPDVPLVRADLEALPFGTAVFGGGWANMSYLHVASTRLPMALADLHRVLAPGASIDLQLLAGTWEGTGYAGDDVGERFFAAWQPDALGDVMMGAGFDIVGLHAHDDVLQVDAVRARTLPDTVGPGMRVLFVGLNPSLYAADAGVGYARPGNRFWPALLAAGLVERARDARGALTRGIGLTDLVKRATPGVEDVEAAEFRDGMARVERLVAWLQPAVVCFVGLTGWRRAVDRAATPGLQRRLIAGRPCYVMPSTSGANAHSDLGSLQAHVEAAAAAARHPITSTPRMLRPSRMS